MTAARAHLSGLPFWPRRLSREQAAAYLGVSTSLFDERVIDGKLPKPLRWGARRLWDIKQLDAALDAEIGIGPELRETSVADLADEAAHAYRPAGRKRRAAPTGVRGAPDLLLSPQDRHPPSR